MHKINKKQIEKPVNINRTLFKNIAAYAILFFILLSLTAPLISSFITSGTAYSSNQTIISSGGTNISSASYRTTTAIAQVVIGNISSANYKSYLGFFHALGEVNAAPAIADVNIIPSSPSANDLLDCGFNVTDADNDNVVANVTWYRNNTLWTSDDENNITVTLNTWTNTTPAGDIESADTEKGESWICSVNAYDNTIWSGWTNSTSATIGNTAPEINLTKPENGNTTVHDKTPAFEWNAADADNDTLNYTIYIYNSSDLSYLVITANTSVMNYTPAAELELDIPYYWKVMVYDQTTYVNSSVWNFTIESYKAITLVDDTSSFGTMSLGEVNDTTNNNPAPLRIRNDGNLFVNITLNATALWSSSSASLGTSYYQFRADNVTAEIGAFSWSSSTTSWANMQSSQTSIIKELNYNNSIDEAEIELRVEVPLDEPSDSKTSTITVETQ